jgi:phosphomannomutase
MKKGIAFGSTGWRGRLGDNFTEENVILITHAFIRYLNQQYSSPTKYKVVNGFDGRTRSGEFASLIARVLAQNGIDVLLSTTVVPTPVLSFATLHNACTSGIMVTGGDLPSEYNGIEFKGTYGGPFTPEAAAAIEALLSDPNEKRAGTSSAPHGEITLIDLLPDYLSHIETLVDFPLLRSFAENPKNNANVLVDSMGGTGQTIIEDILVGCGWRAQTLFGTPESRFFDRCPEAAPKNLDALKYNVTVIDAQFGIATDGDGSRCTVVYNDGEWMNAQDTALALAWHLHDQGQGQGSILKSASVTDKVKRLCQSWKTPLIDLGFGSGVEGMLKPGWFFGVPAAGGFCYGKHVPECDGILSGLFAAEMIAKAVKPLREITQEIWNNVGRVYYDSIDLNYGGADPQQVINVLLSSPSMELASVGKYRLEKHEIYAEKAMLKIRWDDCRWLLFEFLPFRAVVRLHCEALSKEDLSWILEIGSKYIRTQS